MVLREQKRGLKSNFKNIFKRDDDLDAEFDKKLAKINAEIDTFLVKMREDFSALVIRKGRFLKVIFSGGDDGCRENERETGKRARMP